MHEENTLSLATENIFGEPIHSLGQKGPGALGFGSCCCSCSCSSAATMVVEEDLLN